MAVLDGAGIQKMKQHALAWLHANRLTRSQRFIVDGKNIGSDFNPTRTRIEHRRLFRLRSGGIEIVVIHEHAGEIGLPIAQREVMFLIEVARIVRALDDQKSEHAGISCRGAGLPSTWCGCDTSACPPVAA